MNEIVAGDASQEPVWPSVEDTEPEEQGGPIAREGFNYQDEIAVSFLLEMIEKPALVRVHCETHDDIVLIRTHLNQINCIAEYVQVKGDLADQLWTPYMLCNREKAKVGSSIFDKSLGRDKHAEDSIFRIVTRRPVNSELALLKYDRSVPERQIKMPEMLTLCTTIETKSGGYKSAKGNGASYWLERCLWEERQSLEDVRRHNLIKIMELAKKANYELLLDQAEVLLNELRSQAKRAGAAKWIPDKHLKIINREDLLKWWQETLQKLLSLNDAVSGGKLQEKMEAAELTPAQIKLAIDLRLEYAREVRTQKYMKDEEAERLQRRIKSEVNILQANYVAGNPKISAAEFHALCVSHIENVAADIDTSNDNLKYYAHGCMYDITDRCLLQFVRAST